MQEVPHKRLEEKEQTLERRIQVKGGDIIENELSYSQAAPKDDMYLSL